jgi:secreted trypsin-like serine protease
VGLDRYKVLEYKCSLVDKGDSGSALVVRENGTAPVQVGVVSYGVDTECGQENTVGIYARVQHFMPWINQIINS